MGFEWAVNLSAVFGDLPTDERPAAAGRAGFEAVESWWPFDTHNPSNGQIDSFCAAIDRAGVNLVALNLFGGTAGKRGVLSDPSCTREFSESLDTTRIIADRLGTTMFNAPYGPSISGLTVDEQDAVAALNLAEAAARLSPVGAVLLLEALSSPEPEVERFPLDTLVRADGVAVRSGAESVGLLFDQYHLESNGADLPAELNRWSKRILHVQIADAPGRQEPGTGSTDYGSFFRALHAVRYQGYVALEFFPGTADPLRHWREHRDAWERSH